MVVSSFRRGFAALFDEDSDPALVTFQPTLSPLHPWAVELETAITPYLKTTCHIKEGIIDLASGFRIETSTASITELKIRSWTEQAARHALQRMPNLQQTIENALPFGTGGAVERWFCEDMRGILGTDIVDSIVDAIGRGPGSTPSEDDYLVGQLAVQWAMHRTSEQARHQLEGFQKLCQWEHLKERTPIGSAQMILAATAGQFPEPVCDVMKALGMDPSQDVYGPANILAKQGVTSGQATLAGILDGLKYLAF